MKIQNKGYLICCSIIFAVLIVTLDSCTNLSSGGISNDQQQIQIDNLLQAILRELNAVRTNPSRYAEEVIAPRIPYFEGKLYKGSDSLSLLTNEGVAAVRECVEVLKKAEKVNPLVLEAGLCKSAQWLADDQARTGHSGHVGSDGSSPFERMNRYGTWLKIAGENCAYGPKDAREIVVQLLIDDGVPQRGHRDNILKKEFSKVGIGFNDKDRALFGAVTVMDFAGGYIYE